MFQSASFGGLAVISVAAIIIFLLAAQSPALAQAAAADDNASAAKAAGDWIKNNPTSQTTAPEKPVPKDNAQPQITPADREKLGLPAPTWVAAHGKVHPAVREALDDQRKRIEVHEPMIEFQGDRPVGFQGMAYVDVYLRHQAKGKHTSKENQAAVEEAQTRILSKLTAAEFSLIFEFHHTAGLVGYVNETGLAKLVADQEMIAIGLDDQPRPEDPPLAVEEPRVQGEHNERRGKVDLRVYEALEKSSDGYALVAVNLEQIQRNEATPEAQKASVLSVHKHVLSQLSADEFRVRGLGVTFPRIYGYINNAGLVKMDAHEYVIGIGLKLKVPIRFPARYRYKGREMPTTP